MTRLWSASKECSFDKITQVEILIEIPSSAIFRANFCDNADFGNHFEKIERFEVYMDQLSNATCCHRNQWPSDNDNFNVSLGFNH